MESFADIAKMQLLQHVYFVTKRCPILFVPSHLKMAVIDDKIPAVPNTIAAA